MGVLKQGMVSVDPQGLQASSPMPTADVVSHSARMAREALTEW